MPLQKQVIDIPLGVGVDFKLAPKLVQPGSLLSLTNGEFSNTGTINKRSGFTALTQSILSGSSISAGKALAKLGSDLVLMDGSLLYSYSSGATKWVNRGTMVAADIKTRRIPVSSNAQTTDVSSLFTSGICSAHGYTAAVWSTDTGGVFASIYDTTTGTVIMACTQLATAATRVNVHAVASGTKIFLLYDDAVTNIKMRVFDTAAPASGLGAASNLVTNALMAGNFDAKDYDGAGTCVMAYKNTTGGGQMSTVKFTSAGVTAGPTNTAQVMSDHIGVVVSAAGDIYVGFRDNASLDFYCFALTSALAVKFAPTLVEALTSCTRMVGIEQSANSILWVYGDQIVSGGKTFQQIRKASISSAAAVSGAGLVLRGAAVSSGLFSSGGSIYFVALSDSDVGTSSAWLLNTSGEVCGHALDGFAGYSSTFSTPPIVSLGSGEYMTLVPAHFALNNAFVPLEEHITMGRRPQSAEFAQSLYITGGQLWQYDGAQVVEHGFLTAPVISGVDAAGGSLADGSYKISAVYEWYDAVGRRHQSTPATSVVVTIAGGGGVRKITATIQTLRLTNKTGVKVVLYATDLGGTVLHRVSSSDNSKTVDVLTIDFTTVTGLTSNETIYTDGGVLENSAPPGLQSLAVHGRRLYGVTFDGTVNYTKDLVDGDGAAFVAETLVRELTPDGGDDWALAVMDSAVVAFGENSIQALTGEGVNDTGTSDTLSEPRQIPADAGIVQGTPALSTEIGVWFKSKKGLCLLTRSFQVDDEIGRYVESAAVASSLTSIVCVPGKDQIRFGHSDGSALVYFPNISQKLGKPTWSIFTNYNQVYSIMFNDLYCLLKSDGTVWQQSEGDFQDDGSSISMTVRSPWLKLSSLQGFQRLYYLSLLGDYQSDHRLNITLYVNYGTFQSLEVVTKDILASDGYLGGQPLQVRHRSGAKCESIMVQISDSNQSGTGESFNLTSLSLELGGKGGIFRQGAVQTI